MLSLLLDYICLRNFFNMELLKKLFHLPFAWPFVLIYLFSDCRDVINKDIDAFQKVHRGGNHQTTYMLFIASLPHIESLGHSSIKESASGLN